MINSPQNAGQTTSAEYVDFLLECGERHSLFIILEKIFTHLDGKDLAAICCVNKMWANVLKHEKKANQRRIQYVHEIQEMKSTLGQENWPVKRRAIEPRSDSRAAFGDIRNKQSADTTTPAVQSTPISSGNVNLNSDSVNSDCLRRKRLKKCYSNHITPKTHLNSKINSERRTVLAKETYSSVGKAKEPLTGSAKCKRNLKRL